MATHSKPNIEIKEFLLFFSFQLWAMLIETLQNHFIFELLIFKKKLGEISPLKKDQHHGITLPIFAFHLQLKTCNLKLQVNLNFSCDFVV